MIQVQRVPFLLFGLGALVITLVTSASRTVSNAVGTSRESCAPGPALLVYPLPNYLRCVASPPYPDDADRVFTIAELVRVQKAAPDSLRGQRVLLRGCRISGPCGLFGLTDHYNVAPSREADRIWRINYTRIENEQLPAPHIDSALLVGLSQGYEVLEVGAGYNQADPCAVVYVGHFFGSSDDSPCIGGGPESWRVLVIDRAIRVGHLRGSSIVP